MNMVFRWFGKENDRIPLEHVKQIPGVEGIVWALHDMPAGEAWPEDRIEREVAEIRRHGFHADVVESVNVHEDIKLGLPSRDRYIDNYITTMERLARAGVKVICYNFMPVFDWIRTDLNKRMDDGSFAMFYEYGKIANLDPMELVKTIGGDPDCRMPGWEPERLQHLTNLFRMYEGVTEEHLWDHLQYFLERTIPAAKQYGIRLAIHPDDPPWPVFGLPRIMTNGDNIRRFLRLVDHPCNGVTLCSGSLGANRGNDVAAMVREFADRIHFAHIRNVKTHDNGDFVETSHRTCDGTVDIYGIVKAYHDIGYTGYVRPDHGRQIWDETCRPGYGLYDRGMGIMYLWGLWDAVERMKKEAEHVTP